MLIDKVEKSIHENSLIESGDRVVVGVSGGPDSICLLHVLQEIQKKGLPFEIFVAHVNHMLRSHADEEEAYVENYCKLHDIPFFCKRVPIHKMAEEQNLGTEEAGRMARYAFFGEIKEKVRANKIATAHNANDNVETMLLNMIRGCGIEGLKGMEEKSRENIIRPLLTITREEIEEYCRENALNPQHDESNDELIYRRNKIRNVLIPYIEKEFHSNFISVMNRLSKVAEEEFAYIQKQVKEVYGTLCIWEEPRKNSA